MSWLHDTLLSVTKLFDEGYTTVFHPTDGGVTVKDIQGDITGLWHGPIRK